MPPEPPSGTPEDRCAQLLTARNPGWEIVWSADARVYRAWRIENGRPIPPCLTDADPTGLDARLRRPLDDVLTERLRDAVYDLRDRGLLPQWHPPPSITD